jgi:hypothetical protein
LQTFATARTIRHGKCRVLGPVKGLQGRGGRPAGGSGCRWACGGPLRPRPFRRDWTQPLVRGGFKGRELSSPPRRSTRVRHESPMSVVWSGAWVALNATAALLAVLAFAMLIVARQRLSRAARPATVDAASSASGAALPERFRTLTPSADEWIDAVAVTRRSLLASPPGKHPPLPALARPAHGPLPGPDAPDLWTQCFATATTTRNSSPNARLLR